jgi:formylglycine-generating enzyme required for sulfatase activity
MSRYVLELDLEWRSPAGDLRVNLGEPEHQLYLHLQGQHKGGEDENWVGCAVVVWGPLGGKALSRRQNRKERLPLKLINLDGRGALLFDNASPLTLDEAAWPYDLTLRFEATAGTSATVRRCSVRPVRADDLKDLGWSLPPEKLVVQPEEAERRVRERIAGLDSQPVAGKRFAVGTTHRPMTWIAPGEFDMGSRDPRREPRERKHRVQLTKGYWMGEYEVTQGEWEQLFKDNPSRMRGSPYLPVDSVSWADANRFCKELTRLEKEAGRLPEGYEYRLPTEAEWEYACRAGSEEDFSVPPDGFWDAVNSGGQPHEVGEGPANAWGLFDMHGNAIEWCADAWYDYPKDGGKVVDPVRPGNRADLFMLRGGGWWMTTETNPAGYPSRAWKETCRSCAREKNRNVAGSYHGFRVVLGKP